MLAGLPEFLKQRPDIKQIESAVLRKVKKVSVVGHDIAVALLK
jgi:hypothetical protein